MRKLTLPLLLICIWAGCHTSKSPVVRKPQNKSHYHVLRFSRSQSQADSVVVVIHAKKIDDGILSSFIIKVNDEEIYNADGDAMLVISLVPGKYRFKFGSLAGLYPVKTRMINLNVDDSVHINFYSQFKPISYQPLK